LLAQDRGDDNRTVEHRKRTRRLWYGFWVLVVAAAAWFWPGFSAIHVVGTHPPAVSSQPAPAIK